MKESNFVGQKFNKLYAFKKIKKNGRCWYWCRCDCGNEKLIAGWRLKSGYTKSCGCMRREVDSWRNKGKRLNPGLSNARRVIDYYKKNAKRRNINFELSEDECIRILKQKCFYCGRDPFNIQYRKNSWGKFVYSGIDRIDNTKSYKITNVVSCCKDCNQMKKDRTQEDFLGIVSLIYRKTQGKIRR